MRVIIIITSGTSILNILQYYLTIVIDFCCIQPNLSLIASIVAACIMIINSRTTHLETMHMHHMIIIQAVMLLALCNIVTVTSLKQEKVYHCGSHPGVNRWCHTELRWIWSISECNLLRLGTPGNRP